MVVDNLRVLDDLLRREIPQVENRDPGTGLLVDKAELAAVLAVLFAQSGAVRVVMAHDLVVDLSPATTASVTLESPNPCHGSGVKTGIDLRQPHRGHTDHKHLTGMAAGGEHQELVHSA